jgi:hypothetical protein
MKILIFLSTVFAFPTLLFAQVDLPDKGSVADLVGKGRYYLDADADAAKQIRKEMKKSHLVEVQVVAEADFVIEFRILSEKEKPATGGLFPTSNTVRRASMTAYYFRNGKKVVAWSDVKEGGDFSRPAASALPLRFLSALTASR